MDSWTLQGDSYSFLRSAPRTPYSLCHRDGTPNHVEIFDIISSPSQRGAISETTCLCDIFGDDCESPSLSSSPAIEAFVHLSTTAASPPVDDLNDSSGSYHTAPCSSEGEEGLDDQVERIHSPPPQGESCEPDIESSELSKDSSSSFELKSKSPAPQISAEVDSTVFRKRTPSPGRNSPCHLISAASSLSSPSAETRCSLSVLHPGQSKVTQGNNSPSHQSLTPSTSPASMNCNIASSPESVNLQSELNEAGPTDVSSQASNVDSASNLLSHFPSSGYRKHQSGLSVLPPELNNRPSSPDTPSSSPFPELRGRVSLPDLMSRGSTPDIQVQNSIQNSELVGDLPKESTTTPENLNGGLEADISSATSTPVPRYTPPAPVISFIQSHEKSGVFPELKHTSPSPDLLIAPSMNKSGPRNPSPGLSRPNSTSSEIITQACSPVASYSLSPSPGVRSTCSSIESTHTAPSPEIRITASSPEVKRKEYISGDHTTPNSPLLESSRSTASSPHITRIPYSVVQPEDGDTSMLPELCRLPTPESDRIRASASNRVSTPCESSPVSGFICAEIIQSRSQTSSPQSTRHTPSPELRHQSQNSSPEHRSRDPSPATPSPVHRYNQCSPSTLSAEYNTHCLLPTPPLDTHEQVIASSPDIAETQDGTELETESVQPASESDKVEKSFLTNSSSPVVQFRSLVSNSPFLAKEKFDKSLIHQHPKDRLTIKESSYEENQDPLPMSHFNSPTIENNSFPAHFLFSGAANKSLLREEKRLNQHTHHLLKSDNKKSHCAFDHSRQKLGDRARFAQDMAHHVNRRKTPSPPLTRFTPVHIIAPEKPRRHWQSRGHPDSVASSHSGYLKKAVTNRESPNDNNSQPHSVTLGKQLEMERKMQLEEERERQSRRTKREKGGREEWEEWQRDASYRGEQVELSFNAKNRKGPASRSTAPTSRESRQGMPIVHSYSESLPTTRPPQEQQSLLKLASQQDKSGGPTRRLQPPSPQNKISARSVTNKPGRSSSSSMGSELDEADNEVKWLTDVAFRSLSSPEVDYLDMYNSSHRSSTNISQPSTQESPAGVSSAWPTYADFRGSASKLDNDEFLFQQQLLYHSDEMDPSRCNEMGSFECIDVAVEREDSRKVRRGVPKRQIQLKRKESKDDSSENNSPGIAVMENSTSLERHSREAFLRQYSTPAEVQECYTPELCTDPEYNERKNKLQKSVSLDETSSKTKMATCLIKNVLSKKMQGVDKQPDEPDGEEVRPTFGENNATEDNLECLLYSNPSKGPAVKAEQSQRDDVRPANSYGDKSNRPSSNSSNRIANLSHTDNQQSDSQDGNTTALPSEIRSQLRVPLDICQSKGGVQPIDDRKTRQEREGGDSANVTAGNTGDTSATKAFSAHTRMASQQQECENTEVHKQQQQGDKSSHTPLETQETKLKGGEKKKASLNVCLTPEAEKNPETSPADFRQQDEKVQETNVDVKMEDNERNGENKIKGPIHKVRDVRRLVKNTYNLSFKATSSVSPSDINEENDVNSNDKNEDGIKEDVRKKVQGKTDEMRGERTNKCMVEKREEQKVEVNNENLPLQSEGKPSSQLHPMQIQCKAVCWRDDKNKSHKDLDDKTQASSNREQNCTAGIQQGTQEQPVKGATTKSSSQTSDMEAETLKETNDEAVMRSDRKPPMLGSLPKLPSKEREVSTAVVLIRDGSSQAKTSAPLIQEKVHTCPQVVASSPSPDITTSGSAPSNSSHSVSMLLKEKGYQADIGAVVGDNQNSTGGKGVPRKHVNCLEIPLQTPSDGRNEPRREKTFSSSSTMSSPSLSCVHANKPPKTREDEMGLIKQKDSIPQGSSQDQLPTLNKQKEHGDFEGVKRQDATFPPRSPAIRRFRPQPIEVKSLSKETTTKREMTTNSPKSNRLQTIEVKSIAKNSDKPVVPPKPTCKFKPPDFGAKTSEAPSNLKPQSEERSQTIVVSSPTIYRKIPTEATSTSNQTRKLAVSAVSSLKPPSSKITTTSISSLANQSATEASKDRGQQQHPRASPVRLAHATSASSAAPSITSTEGDLIANQVPEVLHASQTAAVETDTHEAATSTTSSHPKPPAAVSATGYTQQQYRRSLSSECTQRSTDHFNSSDDPPSYDERESFSPLMPDLTPRRSNRYQNISHPPPCSCTVGFPPPQPVLPPPPPPPHHHHHHYHNLTPPAPPHSPGHVIPYQVPLRHHQCRADPQPTSFQPSSSPKSGPFGPSQPSTVYQPLHQPPPCPTHPSLMPADRPVPTDPRRLPPHRSPQQQPPSIPGAPYSDSGHSHSPGLGPMDPQYLYGSEYGGDSSSLYSESNYGQTPRRVLLDPETGKYFYIEVPMQPLRKMLFDPETGQYVEVLIPQQAMSHSGLYPPSAAPYSSLPNPNMYGSAPQYMPYAAPPPPAHPQSQHQPPRYPEASATAAVHPNGPSSSFRNCSAQGSKAEPQNHPPLDQSYLDGMYYVPTGMNTSSNATPPVYYHKHPASLPPSGGKRS
ncbi:uncharacterized protein si:ch73-43g23.1 [Dunckerocampus dactyliophorus]|uniref:uncharacterized protein si:ch73-43g23.1 n=1 Tax=Dunckerocampus dactyliophorus TaxID=161453 RepID=UPI002404D511|nr:uncharacterized protein si:ch73-43g23.1 [Dunckerocampus dactyliophorus]